MGKFTKILKLSDPYPNLWYEFSCYVKAVSGTLFLILGVLLIFHPLFFEINLFGIFETGLTPTGLKIIALLDSIIYPKGYLGFLVWGIVFLFLGLSFFWQIKLVRDLMKTLKGK